MLLNLRKLFLGRLGWGPFAVYDQGAHSSQDPDGPQCQAGAGQGSGGRGAVLSLRCGIHAPPERRPNLSQLKLLFRDLEILGRLDGRELVVAGLKGFVYGQALDGAKETKTILAGGGGDQVGRVAAGFPLDRLQIQCF